MHLKLARLWALAGVALLFSFAIYRLGGRGIETVARGLTLGEWTVLIAVVLIFLYTEGVRALQRKWVPQLIERARHLARERSPIHHLLAPLYGMALIGATRAAVMRAWAMVAAIALAVFLVRRMPEPWRGIVDLSVAAALAWGLLFILGGMIATLRDPGATMGGGDG
ncbi:MAG: hypothetical protein WEG36_16290 [Gemmatimonadota bacterium]